MPLSPDPGIETNLGAIEVGQQKIVFEAIRTENPSCSSRGGPTASGYICQQGVITFNEVRINEGQGFTSNGTFIAPSDGVYQFEVSFIAYQTVTMSMKTTLSNQIIRISDGVGYQSNQRTVAKTATMKMEKGDGIYVTNESSNSQAIRADTMYPFIFQGFKIN